MSKDLTDLIDSASIRNGIDNLLAENNSKFLYILADASGSIKLQVYELLLPIIKHTIGYNAYSIATGIPFHQIIRNSPKKTLTLMMYPAGYAYYLKDIRGKEKSNT